MLTEEVSETMVVDPSLDEWPLSQQEISIARNHLAASYDIAALMATLVSNVSRCSSASWTHKCKCPFHSGGNERTPSFFFSEKTGHFKCFSCHLYGDVFDILSKIEGSPAYMIVERAIKEERVTSLDLDAELERDTDLCFEVNFELSHKLFKWLLSRKGTASYSADLEWVERQFKRIDERLFASTDISKQELIGFKIQIEKELQRKS